MRLVVRHLTLSDDETRAKIDEIEGCRFQYLVPRDRLYVTIPDKHEVRLIAALKRVFGEDVERAPFDKVLRDPPRRDKREGTWLKSPGFAEFQAWEPTTTTTTTTEPSALVAYVNSHGSLFAGTAKKKKKKKRAPGEARRKRPKKLS